MSCQQFMKRIALRSEKSFSQTLHSNLMKMFILSLTFCYIRVVYRKTGLWLLGIVTVICWGPQPPESSVKCAMRLVNTKFMCIPCAHFVYLSVFFVPSHSLGPIHCWQKRDIHSRIFGGWNVLDCHEKATENRVKITRFFVPFLWLWNVRIDNCPGQELPHLLLFPILLLTITLE